MSRLAKLDGDPRPLFATIRPALPHSQQDTRPRRVQTWSVRALILLLGACGLYLAFTLSRHRVFQVDEVEHVHAAFEIATGKQIYRDFPQGHNPLIYAFITPLIDPANPVGSFRASRWVPFIILLATASLGAFAAYRLTGEAASWIAGGLILTHSTMVERGIEIRPDGLLALGTVATLAVELTNWPRRNRVWVEGLVLGATFLATQKAAYVCLGFAFWWGWQALSERRIRLFVEPALLAVLPFLLLLAWLSAKSALGPYLRINVFDAISRVTGQMRTGGPFGPKEYILREGSRNIAFMILSIGSLVTSAWQLARRRVRGNRLLITLLAWLAVATLWLNPYPFPYLHITVIPVLAVLIAVQLTEGWLVRKWRSKTRALLIAALTLVAASATSLPRLARQSHITQTTQLGVLSEVQAITDPTDSVFDLVGLYFRPDAYSLYWMTTPLLERYRAGEFQPLIPTLRESKPAVFMLNYRTRSLPRQEELFLHDHFVHLDGPIFVLGVSIRGLGGSDSQKVDILKTDSYRYQGPLGLLVDGAPFVEGELNEGPHTLSTTQYIQAGRILLSRAAQHQADARPPFEIYPPFD